MTSHASEPPGLPSATSGCGRRAVTAMLGASGLSLMAACGGTLLPKLPVPPARFTLDDAGTVAARPATPAVPASLPEGAPVLVVAMPRAAPGYGSRRMVYLRRPQELETFAFHEWVDAPAEMLAPLLVRALQDSAGFRAVLLAPSSAASAWRLETDLIRLHQDFSHAPSQIRLTLRAVLLDTATRQVIAWREFDVIEPATGDDPKAGVHAARRATQGVMRALAAFCSLQALGTATEPHSRPRQVPSAGLPDRH